MCAIAPCCFYFSGFSSMRRPLQSPALISAFFDSLRPEQRDTAQAMQQAILDAAPHLRQEVKWGNLCFVNDRDNVMAIVLHKANAHLQVFNGVQLVGEFPELEGAGRGMRHIKTRYRIPVNDQLVKELTQACLRAWSR
ncbi:DUF1801 domain-containing protein [Aquabacterium sp.]|uniref:DUF1801 domain-containing protein n=1 Tax=Aquabacterium sp. TaxID=1872578 RepID=UPI00344DD2F3